MITPEEFEKIVVDAGYRIGARIIEENSVILTVFPVRPELSAFAKFDCVMDLTELKDGTGLIQISSEG